MSDIDEYVKKRCARDPEFKELWLDSSTERNMSISMIKAMDKANISQSQLSTITGIDKESISLIENGESIPTIANLKKLAKGMNAHLQILFIPNTDN